MNRKLQSILIGLLFTWFSFESVSESNADIPVKWNESIYLYHVKGKAEKTSDFNILLDAKWGEVIAAKVKGNDNEVRIVELSSCSQLISNAGNLYSTVKPANWTPLLGWLLNCKAMGYVSKMKESNHSYIGNLTIDMVKDLSKISIDSIINEEREIFSGLKGRILSDRCYRNYQCQYETERETYLFTLLARGDFDGDSTEDLVFVVDVGYKGGTGGISMGFVVTRKDDDKEFYLIEAFSKGRHLFSSSDNDHRY